jgi:hypothetical protein
MITIEQKLKMSAFVDKHCDSIIGFYCYNLFSFTNFKFAQFIALVSRNYILLNN